MVRWHVICFWHCHPLQFDTLHDLLVQCFNFFVTCVNYWSTILYWSPIILYMVACDTFDPCDQYDRCPFVLFWHVSLVTNIGCHVTLFTFSLFWHVSLVTFPLFWHLTCVTWPVTGLWQVTLPHPHGSGRNVGRSVHYILLAIIIVPSPPWAPLPLVTRRILVLWKLFGH